MAGYLAAKGRMGSVQRMRLGGDGLADLALAPTSSDATIARRTAEAYQAVGPYAIDVEAELELVVVVEDGGVVAVVVEVVLVKLELGTL